MFDRLSRSIIVPARLVFLMWGVFFLGRFFFIDFYFLGVLPRTLFGAVGIMTAPLVHGSLLHLSSNTFPMLFLGTTLYFFYERIAGQVFFYCYFVTGFLVWLLARPTFHIGASGVIYGIAFFLIFFGFFKKDFKSLLISTIIVLFYGGLFYGILPVQAGVSWESHLLGGVVGFGTALALGKTRSRRRDDYFY